MKKTLALLLLIAVCFSLLTACSGIGGFYRVEVTGTQDSLAEPLKSFYKAGTTVKIKANSVLDASLHVFVNDKEIQESIDHSTNRRIFEFVMPEEDVTVHLTYDKFYGRDEFGFDEVGGELYCSDEKITKVAIKTTDIEDESSFTVTKYSSNQEDIDKLKSIFNLRLKKVDDSAFEGKTYRKEIIFYYEDEYGEEFSESLTLLCNGEFFKFAGPSYYQAFGFNDERFVLPTIENPDSVTYSLQSHSFVDVRRHDYEADPRKYHINSSVEFIVYNGAAIDIEPMVYLDSNYGEINLLTSTVFELNGIYYEVVSGKEHWAFDALGLVN